MHDMTESFEMRVVHVGDEAPVLVELTGELDLQAVQIFTQRIDELLASGAQALHVDGTRLTFVDSSGLHGLLEANHTCDRRGAAFRVVGASDTLRRLVDMTHTEKLLPGL